MTVSAVILPVCTTTTPDPNSTFTFTTTSTVTSTGKSKRCWFLVVIVVYFAFFTCQQHCQKRISPCILLLIYGIHNPPKSPQILRTECLCPQFPIILSLLAEKTRSPNAPASSMTSAPQLPVAMVTHLRQLRWLVLTLLLFYALLMSVTPAKAANITDTPRVCEGRGGGGGGGGGGDDGGGGGGSGGWNELDRSQRSTHRYEWLMKPYNGFLYLLDEASSLYERKFYLGMTPNGSLETSQDPYREVLLKTITISAPDDETEGGNTTNYFVLIDPTGQWYLCLNETRLYTQKSVAGGELSEDCVWTGCKDPKTFNRIRLQVGSQSQIQIQENPASPHSLNLFLLEHPPAERPQNDVCSQIRLNLELLAQREFTIAFTLYEQLTMARDRLVLALFKQKMKPGFVFATEKLINRLVQLRLEMVTAQWDYDGMGLAHGVNFLGISGARYHVPQNLLEEVDAYLTHRSKIRRLEKEERRILRDLFNRTKFLPNWRSEDLKKCSRRPSLSNILRGLSLTSADCQLLQRNLFLIGRYLLSLLTSNDRGISNEIRKRSVILKLEEILVRRQPQYQHFLSNLECFADHLKALPGRQNSTLMVSEET